MTFNGRIAKYLILPMASVLVTLIAVEAGLRCFHPTPKTDIEAAEATPDYSYELVSTDGTPLTRPGYLKFVVHPYLQHKNLPNQHNRLFNINSLGLRGREVARKKPSSTYRIIVLGGSATFGLAASGDDHTIPVLLEKRLNQQGKFPVHIEVINAGVIAYISAQDLVYLETELIDLEPDLVIAYNGYNDFFQASVLTHGCRTPLPVPDWIQFPGFFYEVESLLIEHAKESRTGFFAGFYDWLRPWLLRTAIGRLISHGAWPNRPVISNRPDHKLPNAESLNWSNYTLDSGCVQLISKTYERNMEQMARFLIAYRVPLLVCVQPERSWKRSCWSESEAKDAKGMPQYLPWYDRAVEVVYPGLIDAANRVSGSLNIPYADLRSVFRNRKETVFADPAHLNDRGNEIVAEALSAVTIPLVNHQGHPDVGGIRNEKQKH